MILSNIAATDPIIGPSRGSAQGWIDWVEAHRDEVDRPDDVIALITEIYELCAPDDMPDAFIAVAQAFEETGNFTNRWWKERLNSGSLGVTGDAAQNEASPTFKTPQEAARAQIAHLLLYATGQIDRGGLKPKDDPRYSAYRDGYGTSTYPTLQGLTGRWAADPFYAAKIAQRQQEIYPVFSIPVEAPPAGGSSVPDLNMTKGLIPMPTFSDWLIPDANNQAWDDLGQRTVKGFVLHRQLGSNLGTNGYFRTLSTGGSAGLTDYGQDAQTGDVIRWNDPLGAAHDVDYMMSNNQRVKGHVSANRAGWASGVYNGAYGDGLKFAQKYGINAINRDEASWEIDRFYGDAWSAKAMQIAAQACAHYAHDYGIPWDQFPIAPQDGFSFVRWHQEFTLGTGKVCPGDVVMAQTDTFIGLVKAILKQYQTAGAPETPEPPKPIPVSPYPTGMTEQLARELYGSVSVSWASKPFAFDLKRSECRAWLEFGKGTIPKNGTYKDGNWGVLERVIRRGNKGSTGRVYQYSNGFIYYQAPAKDQKEQKAA